LHERAVIALGVNVAGNWKITWTTAHIIQPSDNVAKSHRIPGGPGQQALQRPPMLMRSVVSVPQLNLLQKLPDDPKRFQRELLLQLPVRLIAR